MSKTKLPPLYSLTDAAKECGVTPQTLADRADRTGIGTRTVGGSIRVFTAADVAALKKAARPRGNPNFSAS